MRSSTLVGLRVMMREQFVASCMAKCKAKCREIMKYAKKYSGVPLKLASLSSKS